VTMLAFPLIAAVFALAPILIPLVYSAEFRPAVPLLRWMMAGEIFRFWAWSAAYALLARGGSVPYFIAELTSALAYTALTLVIVPAKGLAGVGIAYVIAQVLYAIVVTVLMRRKTNLSAR
jgi:O-antigen/teichoic acid export membrane protein